MEWQERNSFMNWYLEVLKKYAVFDGRARRKEYWFFILFNILISIALNLLTDLREIFFSIQIWANLAVALMQVYWAHLAASMHWAL